MKNSYHIVDIRKNARVEKNHQTTLIMKEDNNNNTKNAISSLE